MENRDSEIWPGPHINRLTSLPGHRTRTPSRAASAQHGYCTTFAINVILFVASSGRSHRVALPSK